MATKDIDASVTGSLAEPGLSTSQVQSIVDAKDQLGLLAGPVQALIDGSAQQILDVTARLERMLGLLPVNLVGPRALRGGVPYATLDLYLDALENSIGTGSPTGPVATAAPTLSFPGGQTAGQLVVIGNGSYSGTQPTARKWQIKITKAGVTTTVTTSTQSNTIASDGALAVTELYTWAQQTDAVGLTSQSYTIAAVPATPVATSKPQIAITNGVASFAHGLYSINPTGYIQRWLDGANTVLGTGTTLSTTGLSGIALRVEETPLNGAVTGSPNTSDPITIGGGSLPTYSGTGAVRPEFEFDTYAVGRALVLLFNTALNNPQSYDLTFMRSGAVILSVNVTGTGYTYTPTSLDFDQMISVIVTPRNTLGPGTPVTVPGVLIGPGVAVGGGAISYVDVDSLGSNSSGLTIPGMPIPPSSLTADLALMGCATNSGVAATFSAVGWTPRGNVVTLATPEGQSSSCLSKILGASEAPFTLTCSVAEYKSAIIASYRGATRVVDSKESSSAASNSSPINVSTPIITADAVGQKMVMFVVFDVLNGAAQAVSVSGLPDGFQVRRTVGWDGTNYQIMVLIDGDLPASGAMPSFNFSASTDSTATGWSCHAHILGN